MLSATGSASPLYPACNDKQEYLGASRTPTPQTDASGAPNGRGGLPRLIPQRPLYRTHKARCPNTSAVSKVCHRRRLLEPLVYHTNPHVLRPRTI